MTARLPATVAVDTPLALYRLARQFAAVVLTAVLLKWLLFSVIPVISDQMEPALRHGDRMLIRRALGAPRLLFGAAPRRGAVVLCRIPHRDDATRSFLRVAAVAGDSIRIDSAQLIVAGVPHGVFGAHDSILLPPEYAPRDFFALLTLPRSPVVLHLDSLTQRDFLFAASMYRQQHPGRAIDVVPQLFIDAIPSNEYIIENFLPYQGVFASIPDSLDYDWFFWDRLRENLRFTLKDRQVRLRFSLMENAMRLDSVRILSSFVFVLADNWEKGYDSRYFGPLHVSRIQGIAVRRLWTAR